MEQTHHYIRDLNDHRVGNKSSTRSSRFAEAISTHVLRQRATSTVSVGEDDFENGVDEARYWKKDYHQPRRDQLAAPWASIMSSNAGYWSATLASVRRSLSLWHCYLSFRRAGHESAGLSFDTAWLSSLLADRSCIEHVEDSVCRFVLSASRYGALCWRLRDFPMEGHRLLTHGHA